ncbi:SRPBCC family protein [Halobacillus sp. A5]|uniref:SRPBCC family protein n=1 Tax=Halobacillus sp. A5 TaxID=2880263 RepID=UPI0020A6960C|nr:SRPBCC family protein [Halobacillus sp. A5]MCP3027650.1 SRPBCC family protein [Halobacillus sp. A5]
MNNYGRLYESNGRYALQFERFFPYTCEEAFRVITNPEAFVQWYPFATGEMDLQTGGRIYFDDGEGSTYEAVITELEAPHKFSFQEVDDLLEMSLHEEDEGCRFVFTHTFDDQEMAMYVAAGWHRCLDVLEQIIRGEQVEWKDNAVELREYYRSEFN